MSQRSLTQVGIFPSIRDIARTYFAVPSDLSKSGVQLFILGAAVAALRKLSYYIINLLDRTFVSRAEIDSRDDAYLWIKTMLGDVKGEEALHFTVSQSLDMEDDANNRRIVWIPAPGMHLLFHHGRPVLISREVGGDAILQRPVPPSSSHLSDRLESFSIATFATTPAILHSLIESARDRFILKDQSRTVVSIGTQYGGWARLHDRPVRPLGTVILSPVILNSLLHDMTDYLSPSTEKWYAERGIPYRRGYLFSGAPGTGKTSLAVALAGHYKLGVYVVSLSGKGMNDDTLIELLGNMPRRSILLLEDIDVAFPNRAVGETTTGIDGVTASGLLNALDGVAAQEGRIVILTTNYKQRLDSALIRPGRVDFSIEFTRASSDDCAALFLNFFGTREKVGLLANEFGEKCGGERFSIAELQGYLMHYKENPQKAVENVEQWYKNKS